MKLDKLDEYIKENYETGKSWIEEYPYSYRLLREQVEIIINEKKLREEKNNGHS